MAAPGILRLGGLTLVIAPYPAGVDPVLPEVYRDGIFEHGYGIGHFGLQVEDLDEAMETLRRRGATVLAEPRVFVGARFAYIGAPDGVIVELLEHRAWAAFLGPGPAAA